MVRTWAGLEPPKAVTWLVQNQESLKGREAVLSDAVGEWADRDPQAAALWAAEPAGPAADAVPGEENAAAVTIPAVQLKALPRDVQYFADASVPLDERRERLKDLGDKRDTAAIRTLLKTDAANDIAALLRKNRTRDDGLNELVEGACIATLRKLATPEAVPVLSEELELFCKEGRRDLDYGVADAHALWASDKEADGVKETLTGFTEQLNANMTAHLEEMRAECAARGESEQRTARGEQMVRQSYESSIKQIEDLITEL